MGVAVSGLLYAYAALVLVTAGVLALYGHPVALAYLGAGAAVAAIGWYVGR